MKKLLVGTAAIGLGLVVAAPAHAQLQLGVAGHFKGYADWSNQDTQPVGAGADVTGQERHFDIIRDTEIHLTGETTLDNGLTVGVHVEAMADAGDSFAVDESYAYMSGFWGRLNVGDEDGSAYLLQVAAPSADSNVDGIRQYVNPINYSVTDLAGGNFAGGVSPLSQLDYANDATRHDDKLTYLSPVFSGFQVGVSYTPSVTPTDGSFPLTGGGVNGSGAAGAGSTGSQEYNGAASRTFGNDIKLDGGDLGTGYEGAARWEGTYRNVGLNVGGGYTYVRSDNQAAGFDNFKQWNVGADANFGPIGVGGVYTKNNEAATGGDHEHTEVAGIDYTTGPFKLGGSYLFNKIDGASPSGGNVNTDRYSAGVVYTFAPGMSFRGSAGYITSHVDDAADVDGEYGLLGTQINF